MDVHDLKDIPPWEWPEGSDEILVGVLRDHRAAEPDRLLAAELAGEYAVIGDEVAGALLDIAASAGEPEGLRARAAIALGPILEYADAEGFEEPEDMPITEDTFDRIQQSLHDTYLDRDVPQAARRSILEASVRAPREWHEDAVRSAYASDDEAWRLTAVFCMRFVPGFDEQILEALESANEDFRYHAVCAAGNWAVDAAWDDVVAMVTARHIPKPLRLAAIEAVADIRPEDAIPVLGGLLDSDDAEIVDAASEALAIAEGGELDDDEDDELF